MSISNIGDAVNTLSNSILDSQIEFANRNNTSVSDFIRNDAENALKSASLSFIYKYNQMMRFLLEQAAQ